MTAWNAPATAQTLAPVPNELKGTRAAVFHVLRMHDQAKARATSAASPGGPAKAGLVNSQETKAAAGISRPAARCLPEIEPIVRGEVRLVGRKSKTSAATARKSPPVHAAPRNVKNDVAGDFLATAKWRSMLEADEFDFAR